MPEKKTLQSAKRAKSEGKAPSTQAGAFVKEEFEHIRKGKHGARSTKQAIAIGLSKARRAGVPLKPPAKGSAKTKKNAASTLKKGKSQEPISKTRSTARRKALKREPKTVASHSAISRQVKSATKRGSPSSKTQATKRATKSPSKPITARKTTKSPVKPITARKTTKSPSKLTSARKATSRSKKS